MRLIGGIIIENNEKINSYFNLGFVGFFSQSNIENLLIFFSKEISKKITNENTFVFVNEEKTGYIGCFKRQTIRTYCLIYSDVNNIIIKKIMCIFCENNVKPNEIVNTYNDPSKLDELKQIKEINKKLNETKEILYSTIDELLDRGEKLDDLVMKSGELSKTTKDFYGKTRKLNSCCTIS